MDGMRNLRSIGTAIVVLTVLDVEGGARSDFEISRSGGGT